MHVKKLEIFNFGQHSHLDLNFNGSVVGIIGPNGHGKSTIAQAITFAFLGELPDVAKDVIKHGEKELKVVCDFSKNDVDYHIERTVSIKGKSTRSLSYDGLDKPITVAKKVDEFMEQLLGADKQTIKNCIFISQGDIDSIVNESASKRVELLVKLLNLNYINRRSALVDSAIKQIESTVVPIAPMKQMLDTLNQEYQGMLNVHDAKLAKFEENYGSKEFVDFVINEFQNYKALVESTRLLQESISSDMQSIVYLRDSMQIPQSADINVDNVVEQSEKYLDQEKALLGQLEQKYVEDLHNHYRYEECLSVFDNFKLYYGKVKSLEELRNKVFFGKSDKGIEELKQIVKTIKDYRLEYKNNAELYDFSVQTKKRLENEIKELEEEKVKADAKLSGLDAAINSLSSIQNSLNTLLVTKTQIKAAYEKNPDQDHTCPLCGLKLEAGQKITDKDIADLKGQIQEIDRQYSNKLAEKSTLSVKVKQLTENHWIKSNNLKLEEDKIRSYGDYLQKNPEPKDYVSIKLQEADIQGEVDIDKLINVFDSQIYIEFTALAAMAESNAKAYAELRLRFKDLTNVDLETIEDIEKYDFYKVVPDSIINYSIKPDNSHIESQKNKILNIASLLSELKLKVDGVLKKRALIQDSEEQIKNHKVFGITKSIQDFQNNENKCKLLNFSDMERTVQTCANEGLLAYKEIEALNEELRLKARDKTLKEQEIATLEASNHEAYDKIAELSAMLDLLNPKEGIIKQYLRYLFSVIQSYVSEYLALMEANFIIDVDDPDYAKFDQDQENTEKIAKDGLSFKFLRTDQENASWLGMHRLSGGQKIKLAISILLAIQKLVCPELSFLVLDEPSTHLDDGSINALSNMLSNLQDNLNLSNGQVFIIDHNEILNRSFTTTIQL